MRNTQNLFEDYEFDTYSTEIDMSNKLFCTFVELPEIEEQIQEILKNYNILYSKIFVLRYQEEGVDKYVCTYNVDMHNVLHFLENTILVHRKKYSNTLYTINALNELIKELNNGRLDKRYDVNWNSYKNTLLLTKGEDLFKFKTFLHDIVEI